MPQETGDLTAALKYAVELAPSRQVEIEGKTYTDKPLTLVQYKWPMAALFAVNSLSGLVDLLEGGIDNFDPQKYFLHVVDHTKVELVSRITDEFGRRQVLVSAAPLKGLAEFAFNKYMDSEEFVIAMLSQFVESSARAQLVEIASKLDSQESVKTEDDGVTQVVTVRQGVAMAGERRVTPTFALQPFRTFRDVEQPESRFLFRVKQGGFCALFEADGGTWKLTAINLIAQYLQNALNGSPVEPLKALPVIS